MITLPVGLYFSSKAYVFEGNFVSTNSYYYYKNGGEAQSSNSIFVLHVLNICFHIYTKSPVMS